jgi:hypothetical protein
MGERLKITVYYDLARYPHVKLERDQALAFISLVVKKHGATRDLEEAERYIRAFDEFYGIAWRRSNGYIIVPKDSKDTVTGRVVVHKIRLLIENGVKVVELILDRRVSRDLIESCLRDLGYSEIEYASIDS